MRFDERLEQVFGRGDAGRRKGRIARIEPDGSYIVTTASGVQIRAEAAERYRLGEYVTVFQGRILGRTGGGQTNVVEV